MNTRCGFLLLLLLSPQTGRAQHYVEVRGADSKYRFADWNYTFSNSLVTDAFYVGVPGSNEFNVGAGYVVKAGPSLIITPLAYAVIGKEGGQRGVKTAVLVTFDRAGWKLNSFFGHYARISGSVSSYQVLDTLDLSRSIRTRWELGVSNGFFHSGDTWGPQIGPLVKRNDKLGTWAASYRFGPQRELRVSRVFVFKG